MLVVFSLHNECPCAIDGLFHPCGHPSADPQNVLVLVVSVFLSNFPEALSSSGLMRSSGLDGGPILAMWTTTMLTTGSPPVGAEE